MKLFICNIEHKPNYIYLMLHFFILKFQHLSGISDKYVLRFNFITYVKAAFTAWLIIIPTLLSITLSLSQNSETFQYGEKEKNQR